MRPTAISIRAVRGFQDECTIPLSPSLTVIYGGNGRGKTSICEAWHWLYSGEMLPGLEPRSELASAVENIHAKSDPLVRLLDSEDEIMIERRSDGLSNPARLPLMTSPVLLQYRLQQILFTSQGERRSFFQQVLELDTENDFAQKIRRVAQSVKPEKHEAWKTWERAVSHLTDEQFTAPFPSPKTPQEQKRNEESLIQSISDYFGCEPSVKGIEAAVGGGDEQSDSSELSSNPPVTRTAERTIKEALSAISSLDAEAEKALHRVRWQLRGAQQFAEPPLCPFCGEETLTKAMLTEIEARARSVENRSQSHKKAQEKLSAGISTVRPLVELDIPTSQQKLQELKIRLHRIPIEVSEQVFAEVDELRKQLNLLERVRPTLERLTEPDVFNRFASRALRVSLTWISLESELRKVKEELHARQTHFHYVRAAFGLIQYFQEDLASFLTHLTAKPIVHELGKVTPRAVNDLSNRRLLELSDDIQRFYRILRPNDPVPLDSITTTGGVRGDIRIYARSQDKVEHASMLFSYSNANALGMAAHIARVLHGGHWTIVLDDPFQSLDDTNRGSIIQRFVRELIDEDIQVVILTHEREAARELMNMYSERDVLGTNLSWDAQRGICTAPLYPDGDSQLSAILAGLEKDNVEDISKIANNLRKMIEGFCVNYLRADTVQADLPMPRKKNLGGFIPILESLGQEVRPTHDFMKKLRHWNKVLSQEGHYSGELAPGMDELRDIAREVLKAQRQERQLKPPGQTRWTKIPRDGGLKLRMKKVLGDI